MSYNVTTDISIHHVEDFEVRLCEHPTFTTLKIVVLTKGHRDPEAKETAEIDLFFHDLDTARKALASLLCVTVEDKKG